MQPITDLADLRRAIANTPINVPLSELRRWGTRFEPLVRIIEQIFKEVPNAVYVEKPSAIGILRVYRKSADLPKESVNG